LSVAKAQNSLFGSDKESDLVSVEGGAIAKCVICVRSENAVISHLVEGNSVNYIKDHIGTDISWDHNFHHTEEVLIEMNLLAIEHEEVLRLAPVGEPDLWSGNRGVGETKISSHSSCHSKFVSIKSSAEAIKAQDVASVAGYIVDAVVGEWSEVVVGCSEGWEVLASLFAATNAGERTSSGVADLEVEWSSANVNSGFFKWEERT
jgi:hypothetical protein